MHTKEHGRLHESANQSTVTLGTCRSAAGPTWTACIRQDSVAGFLRIWTVMLGIPESSEWHHGVLWVEKSQRGLNG